MKKEHELIYFHVKKLTFKRILVGIIFSAILFYFVASLFYIMNKVHGQTDFFWYTMGCSLSMTFVMYAGIEKIATILARIK